MRFFFGGGRAKLPGRRISFDMYVPPHKTIRASLECTNQSREAPVSIVRKCYWTSLCESRIPSHDFYPSFPTHHPFTILLMKPLSQAQTRVLAAGARTEESHPRTHVPPPHHRIRSRSPLDRRKDGSTRNASSPLQAGVKGQGVFQMHHCGGSPQRANATLLARGPRGRGVNQGSALPRRQRHNV